MDDGKHMHVCMQLNEMLEEKVGPYMQNIENAALSRPIILQKSQDQKRKVSFFVSPFYLATSIELNIAKHKSLLFGMLQGTRQRRWWFF